MLQELSKIFRFPIFQLHLAYLGFQTKRMLGEGYLLRVQNLGFTYYYLEKYTEAEVLTELLVETSKMVLGEEHPDTLSRLQDLGTIYHAVGKYGEAKALLEPLVKAFKRVL